MFHLLQVFLQFGFVAGANVLHLIQVCSVATRIAFVPAGHGLFKINFIEFYLVSYKLTNPFFHIYLITCSQSECMFKSY